jgi:hypothetical protein
MAKFKPVRPKKDKTPQVQGGLPCVILLFVGIAVLFVVMYLVLKYANG